MRILEFEKLFQKEETLTKALEECEKDFNRIEYWADNMKQGITRNPEEAKDALNELTGIFITLKTSLAIAETEKRNREIKAYDTIRIKTEKAGGKFVSAKADKEASLQVSNYRRIRNIVQAYTNSAEKGISTLQSLLKYMSEKQIRED